MFFNNKGTSLIETMLSIGVVTIVSMQVMDSASQMAHFYLKSKESKSEDAILSDTMSVLGHKDTCSAAFTGMDMSVANEVTSKDILDVDGAIVGKVGSPMTGSNYQLSKISFQPFVPLFSADPNLGQVHADLEFKNLSENKSWTVGSELLVELVGGTNNLSTCIIGLKSLSLWEQNANGILIDEAYKVGIGTDNPQAPLDVAGTLKFQRYSQSSQYKTYFEEASPPDRVTLGISSAWGLHPTSSFGLRFSGRNSISLGNYYSSDGVLSLFGSAINNTMEFVEAGATNRSTGIEITRISAGNYFPLTNTTGITFKYGAGQTLRVNSNLHVGSKVDESGSTSNFSSYKFFVNGGAGGGTAWTVSSSQKIKKNIKEIPSAIQTLKAFEGVEFKWKQSNQEDIGFIAQWIPEAAKHLVTDAGPFLTVRYSEISALLVEGVKELYTKFQANQKKREKIYSYYCKKYPQLKACHAKE